MADLLRALLERPLDARVARAVVTLASAASVGFGVVIALGVSGHDATSLKAPTKQGAASLSLPGVGVASKTYEPTDQAPAGPGHPSQDPQDRAGTAAHVRAERELRCHAALQHVPYRAGGVRIALVGVRGERAVLKVTAPSQTAARRGYRVFLRRFRDPGRAYVLRFDLIGGRGG